MKKNKLFLAIVSLGMMGGLLSSCHNEKNEFEDFEGGTSVYFAYQYPVRTIVLGNDPVVDNSLDNQHKCAIYATMGGAYSGKNITLDIRVANELCDNLYYEDGSPVLAMPSSHYTLASNKIDYKGDLWGYVEVQLNDAYFADAKSLNGDYVIPVVIEKQQGASYILSGTPIVDGSTPARTDAGAWDVQPKDFVLYRVKYINPWDASYLRHGEDKITENGTTTTAVRRGASVEKDEIVKVSTRDITTAVFPVSTTAADGSNVTCDLLLKFDGDNCTISSGTAGMTASGSGKFVKDGEKKSWGNKDRDAIYLEYTVDFGIKQYATVDTLVLQTRGTNKLVTFNPVYNAD